jgi:hypothetical protein
MKRLLPLLFSFVLVTLAQAQIRADYYLPEGVSYDPAVPQLIPGERHLHHHELVAYLKAVDAVSDRITMTQTGETHGGRPLFLLTVTSPANQARIEDIRKAHLAMQAPDENTPVIVWMGYSVHGNEPSGVNAVPLVVYHLAAARGEEIDAMLEKMVILIEPAINPDGMDRFAHWTNTLAGRHPSSDPNDREHSETWPGGRFNYYNFDLNRDWMPVQQPESRARLRNYQLWKPNVVTDHHEMGTNATFFFQPGIPSRNNPLSPQKAFDLTAKIGDVHAQYLNRIGSLYYTKESFDDFYIGKGSTYPDITGSVGILFEQASSRGMRQDSDNGVVTLPFTIKNQFTTTLSTLKASFDLRMELLAHQREVLNNAAREAAAHSVKAYVFGDKHDPARVWHLLDMLSHHDIAVHELSRAITVDGKTFEPGTAYLVPLDQPRHRLIRGMFDTMTSFTDSLFYDVSSWTLPLAFNLDYAALQARSFVPGVMGRPVGLPAFPRGAVVGGFSEYAYVFEWDSYYAPRALNRLLNAGYKVKVAQEPFTLPLGDGSLKTFTYGTILVALGIQESKGSVHGMMETIASENAIQVYAVNTGLAQGGIDLGSPNFASLKPQRVAMLTGDGVAANDAGEVWHQLDVRYAMEMSQLDVTTFNRASLDRYTTIVMVAGSYSGISSGAVEKLKRWVSAGGTLVVYGSAINWAAQQGLSAAKSKERDDAKPDTRMRRYIDASEESGAQQIGGSIFRATIDPTHPLFYGYRTTSIPTFRDHTLMIELPSQPYASPMRYPADPLLSGYISKPQLERIRNSAAVVVSASGSGKVIAATDNPVFRAFWFGTDKLLANAIFFGSTISGQTAAR